MQNVIDWLESVTPAHLTASRQELDSCGSRRESTLMQVDIRLLCHGESKDS